MLWRTFQIDKEPQHKIDIQTRAPNSRTYSGNYETMLRDIINDENLKLSFSQFLQGEFCLENLVNHMIHISTIVCLSLTDSSYFGMKWNVSKS